MGNHDCLPHDERRETLWGTPEEWFKPPQPGLMVKLHLSCTLSRPNRPLRASACRPRASCNLRPIRTRRAARKSKGCPKVGLLPQTRAASDAAPAVKKGCHGMASTPYTADDLLEEVGYSAGLGAATTSRLFRALVGEIERLLAQGRGAVLPGFAQWTVTQNSRRQRGSSVGLDEGDLRQKWFLGHVFAPDASFLRAHGLAAAPAALDLAAPSSSVNAAAVAVSARVDRDAARRGLSAIIRRLGAAAATRAVRVEFGRLGRLSADRRVLRFDFSPRAPRPVGVESLDASFLRAGRDPPLPRPATTPAVQSPGGNQSRGRPRNIHAAPRGGAATRPHGRGAPRSRGQAGLVGHRTGAPSATAFISDVRGPHAAPPGRLPLPPVVARVDRAVFRGSGPQRPARADRAAAEDKRVGRRARRPLRRAGARAALRRLRLGRGDARVEGAPRLVRAARGQERARRPRVPAARVGADASHPRHAGAGHVCFRITRACSSSFGTGPSGAPAPPVLGSLAPGSLL